MKKLFALAAIAAVSSTITSYAGTNNNYGTEIYPAVAIVASVDEAADTVAAELANGLVYEFYGAEDWQTGDLAALLLDDNGTASVFDDKIVSARYSGTATDLLDMSQVVEIHSADSGALLILNDGTGYYWER